MRLTPLIHPHTSTRRGNVSLKPTAAQLTEPNESGLNFTPSCPPTDTHTPSPSHTHLNRPAEMAWALPQQGGGLCCSKNWKSVITPLIGGRVFSRTFPSSHQHFILRFDPPENCKPPAVAAPSPLGCSSLPFTPLRSSRNPGVFTTWNGGPRRRHLRWF